MRVNLGYLIVRIVCLWPESGILIWHFFMDCIIIVKRKHIAEIKIEIIITIKYMLLIFDTCSIAYLLGICTDLSWSRWCSVRCSTSVKSVRTAYSAQFQTRLLSIVLGVWLLISISKAKTKVLKKTWRNNTGSFRL